MSKISELSDGGVIQGGDTLIAVRSGGNVKVTYGGTTTANIDGGTIDGTTIGGTTPAAGSFTSLTSTGIDVTGTVTADGLVLDSANSTINTTAEAIRLDVPGDMQFDSRGSFKFNLDTNNNGTGSAFFIAADANKDNLKFKAAENGDISFYEDTGTTAKFFWDASAESLGIGTSSPIGKLDVSDGTNPLSIDSSTYNEIQSYNRPLLLNRQGNNVGIGTSSPSSALEVSGTSAGGEVEGLRLTNSSTTTNSSSSIIFNLSTASADSAKIEAIRTNSPTSSDTELAFSQIRNGTLKERMRIDSSGNVGIGTDSPNQELHVQAGTGLEADIRLSGNNGASSYLDLFHNAGGSGIWNASNTPLQFATNGTERMRIDSSGHLLVGTTDAGVYDDATDEGGHNLLANGQYYNSTASEINMILNRQNSDGDIIQFRRDGTTTVGSIGADGGAIYIANTAGEQFKFHNGSGGSFYPKTDNNNDLGASSNRFKDLYLSNGINLGGNGAEILEARTETGFVKLTASHSGGGSNSAGFIFRTRNGTAGTNEKMRLTKEGNLLVGTDTTSRTIAGHELHASGFARHTASNDKSLEIVRTNGDGEMVEFFRDTSLVGSIGVGDSDNLYITGGAGSTKGLIFTDDKIIAGANGYNFQDDNTTLGHPSYRFKDLYLSGGAYLGGTGSANKLDDYEEGDKTATSVVGITATTNTVTGVYTKIGNVVIEHIIVTISGKTGGTGNPYVPLSFTPSGDQPPAKLQGGSIGKDTVVGTTGNFMSIYGNGAQVYMNNKSGSYIGNANWTDGELCFTVIYTTP